MKWLDPKTLVVTLVMIWLLLLAAWIVLLMLALWIARNWYWVLLAAAVVVGIRVLVVWLRRRLDQW